MAEYILKHAEEDTKKYHELFRQYCMELAEEDPTILEYDPDELAQENLESIQDHPYFIISENNMAGFVVFMDEPDDPGENDCHTYLGEIYILKEYRCQGLAGKVAGDFFDAQAYDSGLCYIKGSYGEKFWLNLMKRKHYRYKICKEDDIRDFIHVFLRR